MREMTKSMMSFSWALSLFGLRQMTCMLVPGSWRSASSSFDAVTRCTEDQLGSTTDALFRTGDNLQRGMVDMMFSLFTFGLAGRSGNGRSNGGPSGMGDTLRRSMQWGADTMQRTAQAGADAMRQGAAAAGTATSSGARQEDVGWGPMPGAR